MRRLRLPSPFPPAPFPSPSVPALGLEASGSPMFPGVPLCLCPALRPRCHLPDSPLELRKRVSITALSVPAAGFTVLPYSSSAQFCPHVFDHKGSHDILPFEAPSLGFNTRCLRFVPLLPNDYARLASGWWLTFTAWALIPTGTLRRVSIYTLKAHASPLPGLRMARRRSKINERAWSWHRPDKLAV